MTFEKIRSTEQAVEHFLNPVAQRCGRLLFVEGLAILLPNGGVANY